MNFHLLFTGVEIEPNCLSIKLKYLPICSVMAVKFQLDKKTFDCFNCNSTLSYIFLLLELNLYGHLHGFERDNATSLKQKK